MAIITGIGLSDHNDTTTAVSDCLTQAKLNFHGKTPSLLIAFISATTYDPQEVVNLIKKKHPKTPLLGCTSAGQITSSGSYDHSLVVAALEIDKELTVTPAIISNATQNPLTAGENLAKFFTTQPDKPPAAIMLFTPGLKFNADLFLKGLKSKLPPQTVIFGAAAGDDYRFHQTHQFLDKQIEPDAAVGMAIYGNLHISCAARHGWIPIGSAYQVTQTTNNLLAEVNQRPAINMYQDQTATSLISGSDQNHLAPLLYTYPIANITPSSLPEFLLRAPLSIVPPGGLVLNGEIPNASEISLTIGNNEEALAATNSAIKITSTHLTMAPPQLILAFSNVARKKLFMQKKHLEINSLTDVFGLSAPILGFYSYGEFCPPEPGQPTQFQNASFTVICLSS